jgi:hypothetical protein
MKNPFKKTNTKPPKETLQELQASFNQVLFELGDLNYRKTMIKAQLGALESEINARTAKADKMGVDAQALRQRIQEEMAKTAKQGQPGQQEVPKEVPEQQHAS